MDIVISFIYATRSGRPVLVFLDEVDDKPVLLNPEMVDAANVLEEYRAEFNATGNPDNEFKEKVLDAFPRKKRQYYVLSQNSANALYLTDRDMSDIRVLWVDECDRSRLADFATYKSRRRTVLE